MQCVDLDVADNDAVIKFCKSNDIGLVVIGPEAPLVAGAEYSQCDCQNINTALSESDIAACWQFNMFFLFAGLSDALDKAGIKCFGPSAEASQLEGSKAFTKEVCMSKAVPTAGYERFTEAEAAKKYIREKNELPIVVKADGLAAGKGVVVAQSLDEACDAVDSILVGNKFGDAGSSLIVEDFLDGKIHT